MFVRGTPSVAGMLAGVCASTTGAAATASTAPVPLRNPRREMFFLFLDLAIWILATKKHKVHKKNFVNPCGSSLRLQSQLELNHQKMHRSYIMKRSVKIKFFRYNRRKFGRRLR